MPFQPWLRGSLDEQLSPQEMRRLVSRRDLLRRSRTSSYSLLDRRPDERDADVKRELHAAGFRPELIAANAAGLKRCSRLHAQPARSHGRSTTRRRASSVDDARRKERFVTDAVAAERLACAGTCNDGRPDSRRVCGVCRRTGCRSGRRRPALRRAEARRRSERPAADDGRRRPVAGARLAQRRAQAPGRAGPARTSSSVWRCSTTCRSPRTSPSRTSSRGCMG